MKVLTADSSSLTGMNPSHFTDVNDGVTFMIQHQSIFNFWYA